MRAAAKTQIELFDFQGTGVVSFDLEVANRVPIEISADVTPTNLSNLAIALNLIGFKVGILDADIYGPSIPKMIGLNKKPIMNNNKKLVPIENYGLKCMSIGFILDPESPTIWRGPMVMKALEQMFNGVEWGNLDYLIIDLPPGTGDAQLSLAQNSKISGSIIISTPQTLLSGYRLI